MSSAILANFAAHIKAGKYSIGSNSIPNASPVHVRDMRSFWIDRFPISFGHFERFVAAGGYDNKSLWSDSVDFVPLVNVDQRCEDLMKQSILAAELFHDKPMRSSDIPLVGMSWIEAAAIARFADARLPFESEWEVAMQRTSLVPKQPYEKNSLDMIPGCWKGAPRSDWGCVVVIPTLQEWTADAYSPRYWRADSERHGTFWNPSQPYGVSIRGACSYDMHKDHRFRRAADPNEVHSARGFRRVWESQPTADKYSSSFVQIYSL